MAIRTKTDLRTAWRESEAVVRAMGDGKHFLLLSHVGDGKRETEARFLGEHLEFFLFPDARMHRRSDFRPEFHSYLEPASEGDAKQVTLRYRAIVTEGVMVMNADQLQGLAPFHIWSEDFFRREVHWDPWDPPFLVTCKVQRVDPPLVIPHREAYDGSGSWIRIEDDLAPAAFHAVVPHNDYLKVALDVKKAFAEVQKNPLGKPDPPEPAGGPAAGASS